MKLRPTRVARKRDESYENLAIFSALVRTSRPLSADEISYQTGVPVKPLSELLKGLVRSGALSEQQAIATTTYELTKAGFERALALKGLQLGPEVWARAERRFNPPGPKRL